MCMLPCHTPTFTACTCHNISQPSCHQQHTWHTTYKGLHRTTSANHVPRQFLHTLKANLRVCNNNRVGLFYWSNKGRPPSYQQACKVVPFQSLGRSKVAQAISRPVRLSHSFQSLCLCRLGRPSYHTACKVVTFHSVGSSVLAWGTFLPVWILTFGGTVLAAQLQLIVSRAVLNCRS